MAEIPNQNQVLFSGETPRADLEDWFVELQLGADATHELTDPFSHIAFTESLRERSYDPGRVAVFFEAIYNGDLRARVGIPSRFTTAESAVKSGMNEVADGFKQILRHQVKLEFEEARTVPIEKLGSASPENVWQFMEPVDEVTLAASMKAIIEERRDLAELERALTESTNSKQ